MTNNKGDKTGDKKEQKGDKAETMTNKKGDKKEDYTSVDPKQSNVQK